MNEIKVNFDNDLENNSSFKNELNEEIFHELNEIH